MQNISEVETEFGRYQIVYAIHDHPADPEIMKIVDGVILEGITDYSSKDKVEDAMLTLWFNDKYYQKAFIVAQQREKPVFLVDLDRLSSENEKEFKRKESIIPSLEFLLASLIVGPEAFHRAKGRLNGEATSRRAFLKTAAKFLGAAYLSLPLVERSLSLFTFVRRKELDETSFLRISEKTVAQAVRITHPELRSITIDTRNDLIAQKAEAIALAMGQEKKRKPTLAIIIGAVHSGLEDSLRQKGERLERLKNELGHLFSRQGFIARINFRGRSTTISLLRDPNFQ